MPTPALMVPPIAALITAGNALVIKKIEDKQAQAYNMEKSGNQGKVGNPDTSPAPMSVGGINQEPKPMKMDNKPMYGK